MQNLTHSDIDRFWSKVDRRTDDECWPWLAGLHSAGYGAFGVHMPGGGMRMKPAHQIAARIAYGPANGRYVLHSCDNRVCCNPKHLRYGTQLDNVRDAMARNRHVNPPKSKGNPNPPKGEAVWNQTLTEPQVRQIWSMHLARQNHSDISAALGVPSHVINDVCRGRSWRHLVGAPSVAELKAGGVRRDKLTPESIEAIKILLAEGETVKAIAARFNVSTAPISNLKNHGKTWVPKP